MGNLRIAALTCHSGGAKHRRKKAKLHIVVSIALIVLDFRQVFQINKPLVPFLYQHMKDIISKLLEKVIVPKTMKNILKLSDMLDFDLNDDKFLKDAKSIPLNFATKEAVKYYKISNQQEVVLRCDVKSIVVNMVNKIKERSSLKSELVGYLIEMGDRYNFYRY